MDTNTDEPRRAWLKRITSGQRSPFDHLTDGERRVIEALKAAGYELQAAYGYTHYIRKAKAA